MLVPAAARHDAVSWQVGCVKRRLGDVGARMKRAPTCTAVLIVPARRSVHHSTHHKRHSCGACNCRWQAGANNARFGSRPRRAASWPPCHAAAGPAAARTRACEGVILVKYAALEACRAQRAPVHPTDVGHREVCQGQRSVALRASRGGRRGGAGRSKGADSSSNRGRILHAVNAQSVQAAQAGSHTDKRNGSL